MNRSFQKIFLLELGWMFMVIIPVIVPFFEGHGMDMEQIFILQAIFGISVVILEVPSGYVADIVGRKNSLIIATVFHAIGFLMWPFAFKYWHFIVSEIILGVGVSFFSGTTISLLYDNLDQSKEKLSKVKMASNLLFYRSLGEGIGAIAGGALAFYSIRYNTWVQAIVPCFLIPLAFTIEEPKRKKFLKDRHRDNFKLIIKKIRSEKLLFHILLNYIFYSVCTLVAVWSYQKVWLEEGLPLWSFGALWAGTNLTVAFTAKMAPSLEIKFGSKNLFIALGLLAIIGYGGIAFSTGILAVLFCFSFQVLRGILQVILGDAINSRVGSEMRATVNSIGSLGVRLLFVPLGPLLGHLMDNFGRTTAFGSFSLIYLLVFFFVLIPFLKMESLFRPAGS